MFYFFYLNILNIILICHFTYLLSTYYPLKAHLITFMDASDILIFIINFSSHKNKLKYNNIY